MSSERCNSPVNPQPFSSPLGKKPVGSDTKTIPELEFPRKLTGCIVAVYSGQKLIEYCDSSIYDIELLSYNIIKITKKRIATTYYNVAIEVKQY